MDVLLLYNEPTLPEDDPDWAAEAGVLESVASVGAALAARGHTVRRFGVKAPLAECFEAFSRIDPPDVVFNLFEGLGGVSRGEAEIAGLVELLGYPLTGSPAECLALVCDKVRTKWLLAGAGLPTAEFVAIDPGDAIDRQRLRALLDAGPVIVKPAHEDASLGITAESVVKRLAPLVERIEWVRGRYGPVLAERFIAGREFNAAVIELGEPELLPVAEIEFNGATAHGWHIVSYDAKWCPGSVEDRATPARCPARIDKATEARIRDLAIAVFRATGCRDYARVDMRMDERGQLYVLEINGNPDIGPTAGFAPALSASGRRYDEFIEGIVENAYARGSAKNPLRIAAARGRAAG